MLELAIAGHCRTAWDTSVVLEGGGVVREVGLIGFVYLRDLLILL